MMAEANLKQAKQKCTNKEILDSDIDVEVMKEALTNIALEVQRYCCGDTAEEALPDELEVYKTKLEMKRKQIKTLKENLSTACLVAKALTSSKEKECLTLHKHLVEARNEALALQKRNAECSDSLQKLDNDNHVLTAKYEQLKNFIEIAYKELEELRDQPEPIFSTESQLNEIVALCRKFHSEYINEHETLTQLEQKNRFLTNKINLLARELESAKQESQSNRRPVANRFPSPKKHSNGVVVLHQQNSQPSDAISNKAEKGKGNGLFMPLDRSLDLSSHMALVKKLLSDQDTMLADLRKITDELKYT